MKDTIQQKWTEKQRNCWIVHHDNVLCHMSLAIWQFVVKNQIPTILQPLYSPGLTRCDFRLFASLKIGINGHHFVSIDEIQQKVTGLADISKEAFHRCFQQWHVSWSMYVVQKGQCFEGIHARHYTYRFYCILCLSSSTFMVLCCISIQYCKL